MSHARAARRRAERERQKVVGMVITTEGQSEYVSPEQLAGLAASPMPPKIPGHHRWIAVAMYAVTEHEMLDTTASAHLDTRNLAGVHFGCWDCEQPLGLIQPGTHCPADANDAGLPPSAA